MPVFSEKYDRAISRKSRHQDVWATSPQQNSLPTDNHNTQLIGIAAASGGIIQNKSATVDKNIDTNFHSAFGKAKLQIAASSNQNFDRLLQNLTIYQKPTNQSPTRSQNRLYDPNGTNHKERSAFLFQLWKNCFHVKLRYYLNGT